MTDKELYNGHSKQKQEEYKNWLVENVGEHVREKFEQAEQVASQWTKSKREELKQVSMDLWTDFTKALTKGLKPESGTVQKLTAKHYEWVKNYWEPNRESYIGLGQLYVEHPDFRKSPGH